MNRRIVAVCFAASLWMGMGATAWGLGDTGSLVGGAYIDNTLFTEKLAFTDVPTLIQRIRVKIPKDYGTLIQIYPARQGQILWFQNDKGIIRNVLVNEKDLVYIEREGAVSRE